MEHGVDEQGQQGNEDEACDAFLLVEKEAPYLNRSLDSLEATLDHSLALEAT